MSQQLAERNHWHLRSRGPDGDFEARKSGGWADYLLYHSAAGQGGNATATPPIPADGGSHALYDPSNGTLSNGDIVRLGSDGAVN